MFWICPSPLPGKVLADVHDSNVSKTLLTGSIRCHQEGLERLRASSSTLMMTKSETAKDNPGGSLFIRDDLVGPETCQLAAELPFFGTYL